MVVDEDTKKVYESAKAELKDRGGEQVAESVKSFYLDQLRKTLQVVDGYVDERPLDLLPSDERNARIQQERALLLYSEFVLANIRVNSIQSDRQEAGRDFLDNHYQTVLARLNITEEQRNALGFAFNALRNSGEFAFTQSCRNVIDPKIEYLRANDPDAHANGGVRLDTKFINEVHFVRANEHIEDAHRLVIAALDRPNEPARERWIAAREQNPGVDITSPQGPFSDWQDRVESRIAEYEGRERPRKMESRDYINGILGSRKEESGFFGVKRPLSLSTTSKMSNIGLP